MPPDRISSYLIEKELGEGGMAVVYKARHSVLEGEPVAIKVLHAHLTRNESVKQRFFNEARMMHSLAHENIVSVKDVFEYANQLVIVMELVEGRPLSRIIDEEMGPIPYEKAIPLFLQILEGTCYAHSRGIVHRDLKPENILVEKSGRVKITDFGIAKISGESNLTRTGSRLGSPSYMSPEQVLGQHVDRRTDIYSLGVTLYEMLAGRLPFDRSSTSEYALMRQVVENEVPDPREFYPHIPESLVCAIRKSLAKNPEHRFADCGAFIAALSLHPESTLESIQGNEESFVSGAVDDLNNRHSSASCSPYHRKEGTEETASVPCDAYSLTTSAGAESKDLLLDILVERHGLASLRKRMIVTFFDCAVICIATVLAGMLFFILIGIVGSILE